MSVNILIGGDICPTESNYELFQNADINSLVGADIKLLLEKSDQTILNLEGPLIEKSNPIVKCGPHLGVPSSCINGLVKINPYFYTLANNHILDQNDLGLINTIKLLDDNHINYAGAGSNCSEARKPYIFAKDGIKIGIFCCAEHEFSIASSSCYGANPFDLCDSLDDIGKLKEQCDYVIVLYHGGKEEYRYPSPYLQKLCRKMAEKGADIVTCQHTHCVGCKEEWKQGTIIYGQGNFLFDDEENEYWKTGLILDVNLKKENNKRVSSKINYIPLCKDGNGVKMAMNSDAEEIMSTFFERSKKIQDEEFVLQNYCKFTEEMLDKYLYAVQGRKPLLFRVINKLCNHKLCSWYNNCKYKKNDLLILLNYIECEPHREILIEGIKNRLGIRKK